MLDNLSMKRLSMKRQVSIDRPHTPESVPYVIQNLKAVYGAPKPHRGLDPLDVLIETILSQSTTNANSDRAFESLEAAASQPGKHARRARVASIEAAIRSGGLAKQKSVRIKELLNEIHKRRGSLDLSFLTTAPLEEAKQFLASFKGVGPKTVACTLLFACNRPVFPIDTHIFVSLEDSDLIPESARMKRRTVLMGEMIPREALLRSAYQPDSPSAAGLPAARSAVRAVLSG